MEAQGYSDATDIQAPPLYVGKSVGPIPGIGKFVSWQMSINLSAQM